VRPASANAALATAASSGAFATGSLSFESAGYVLDFEVGQQEHSVLAGVSFAAPGATSNAILRPPHLVVVAFDTKAKILIVRYRNPGDGKLPPDFELSVRGSEGILKMPNRLVTGKFNWDM
jgi:hypothetical protein